MGQRLVRGMQPAHQHPDEGLVEQMPGGRAQPGQGVGRERDRRGAVGHDHVGAVHPQLRIGRQIGHLADRGARAQQRHAPAVAPDLQRAGGDDVEGAALLAAAVQRLAGGQALPARAVHHLPQRDVAEAGEEVQRAQQREALGVEHALHRAARHMLHRDQAGERLAERLPRGMAVVGALGQAAAHHPVERRRDPGAHAHQRGWLDMADLVHQAGLAGGLEGRVAGDQVIEHRAQAVDVGTRVELGAVELLRRHVGQRADAVDLRLVRAQVQRAAEVGQLDVAHLAVAAHGQDVGRLDVAVDQPLAVAVAQRHRALEADFDDLVERQQVVGRAEGPQRRAGHVLHHHAGRTRVGHRIQDVDHVRVVQPPGQRRLGGEEAREDMRIGRIAQHAGAHPLDRHLAIVELVVTEEDLAGRALAETADHAVLADALRRVGEVRVGKIDHRRRARTGWAIFSPAPARHKCGLLGRPAP